MTILAVITTLDTRAGAQSLSRELVERNLVACAQISEIESCFRWDGAIQQEPEFRLVLKTVAARYAELEVAIAELHPYDVPAIYAFEAHEVFGPYAEWVTANTQGP
ncbi:MAG: divalent-cation tolerance protein CutA [Pseudomonadota bacterium]